MIFTVLIIFKILVKHIVKVPWFCIWFEYKAGLSEFYLEGNGKSGEGNWALGIGLCSVFGILYSVVWLLVIGYSLLSYWVIGEDGVLLPTLIVVFHRQFMPVLDNIASLSSRRTFLRQAGEGSGGLECVLTPSPSPKKGEGGVQGRGYFVARYWLFVIELLSYWVIWEVGMFPHPQPLSKKRRGGRTGKGVLRCSLLVIRYWEAHWLLVVVYWILIIWAYWCGKWELKIEFL